MTSQYIIPTGEPYFWPGGSTGCLLIHGFTCTPRVLRPVGEFLRQQGHTVLGIRLPGHATGIENLMQTRYQDWLASVEDGWHLLQGHTERVFAVGFSLGGSLSLLLASKFPVAGIVTLACLYDLPSKLAKSLGPLIVPLSKVWPKRKKEKGGWVIPEREKDYLAYNYNPVHQAWELILLLKKLRAAVPYIHTPTLIIHSKDDGYVRPYQAEKLYEQLGSEDKELIWIEGSGHIITRDGDPSQLFKPIAAFIERISTSV